MHIPEAADWTNERLLAGVSAHVLVVAALVVEGLVAQTAWMNELALMLVLTHSTLMSISKAKK